MNQIPSKAMRKSEIRNLLKPIPDRMIRTTILDVITSKRKVSRKEACDTKTLLPNEVEEIFNRLQ